MNGFLNFLGKYKKILLYSFLIVLGLVSFNMVIDTFAQSISLLFVILAKVGIAGIIIYIFDDIIMSEIDTIEELKNGNIAYGLFLLGVMILIGMIMVSL